MSRSRRRCRDWQWLRLCGDYGGRGYGARAEIGVDRRLRMVMDVIRGEKWVGAGIGRWRIKDGTSRGLASSWGGWKRSGWAIVYGS